MSPHFLNLSLPFHFGARITHPSFVIKRVLTLSVANYRSNRKWKYIIPPMLGHFQQQIGPSYVQVSISDPPPPTPSCLRHHFATRYSPSPPKKSASSVAIIRFFSLNELLLLHNPCIFLFYFYSLLNCLRISQGSLELIFWDFCE